MSELSFNIDGAFQTCPVDDTSIGTNWEIKGQPVKPEFDLKKALALSRSGLGIAVALYACSTKEDRCHLDRTEIINESSGNVTSEHENFILNSLEAIFSLANFEDLPCNIRKIKVVDHIPFDDEDEYVGQYINGVIKITWNHLNKLSYDTFLTLAHEVGHHMHMRLEAKEREKFRDITWDEWGNPLTNDPRAFLESNPYSDSFNPEEEHYGARNWREDFATQFAYYLLAPDYLEEQAKTNPYIARKLQFMKEHFPKVQNPYSLTVVSQTPVEQDALDYYNPNYSYLDQEDGRLWSFYIRGDTLSPVHFDSEGKMSLLSPFMSLKEADENFLSDGKFYQLKKTDSMANLGKLSFWITDLKTGKQQKFISPQFVSSKVEIMDIRTEEGAVYYHKKNEDGTKTLYKWSYLQNTQTIVLNNVTFESGLALNTDDYFYYAEQNTGRLYIYNKMDNTLNNVIIPNYFYFSKLIPVDGTVLILGSLSQNIEDSKSPIGFIFNPQDHSFTPYQFPATISKISPADQIKLFWDENILRLRAFTGSTLYDFSLSDQSIGVVGNKTTFTPPTEEESVFFDIEVQEDIKQNLDNKIMAWDYFSEQFFILDDNENEVDEETSSTNLEIINSENEVIENIEVKAPKAMFPLHNIVLYSINQRLVATKQEEGLTFFYELDWDTLAFEEITAEEVDTLYQPWEDSTGDLYFSTCDETSVNYNGEENTERILSFYNYETGHFFDLPPTPIDKSIPKDILVDGNTIYIIATNWFFVFDMETQTYTKAIPSSLSGSYSNYMIHQERPLVIYKSSETQRYIVTDLLTGISEEIPVDEGLKPKEFRSDGESIFGYSDFDPNPIIQFKINLIIEK